MDTVKSKSFGGSILRTLVILSGAFALIFLISVVADAQTSRSDAGFFAEPFLTYERGDGNINYPSPLGSTDVETEGFGLGARVGMHVADIFFVGLDGRYSMPKFSAKDAAESSKVSSNAYNIGPTVGVQTPFMGIRVWGTYLLDGQLDPKQLGNGLDIKLKDLEGYRIGFGGYIYNVSLNLEYQNAKFGSLDLQQIGPLSGPSDITSLGLRDETFILSVSFPITL